MIYEYPSIAIKRAKESLFNMGQVVEQLTWQNVSSPDKTIELTGHEFGFKIPLTIGMLAEEVKPNLPWAEDHFKERVGGEPLNPGNEYKNWPYFKYVGERFKKQGKFSHTYMERFWPKRANGGEKTLTHTFDRSGIRYTYGDYQDVVELLKGDPSTRQGYLPIWFPEDTGNSPNMRVPCSLGYHFIIRNGHLHVFYFMRSCDIVRHFRDDIYLACRLVFDLIGKTGIPDLKPGVFRMFIGSLHCFISEKGLLLIEKT